MQPFSYADAPVPVREDLTDAHRRAWQNLARPGNWWTGAERVAIADELRAASSCQLCRERKAALKPNAASGSHDTVSELPDPAIEAIHRITSDPARLTRTWFDELATAGLDDGHYVELLGVVVCVLSIDAFHRALGVVLEPLPRPEPGEPSRRRPEGLAPEGAWLPMIRPERLGEAERGLYGRSAMSANVIRAMSLVPDAVRELLSLSAAQYLAIERMQSMETNRALDRPQMELLAGRVSALNECFY